ncbi:MAG: chlorophyll synthesis pathway protein BchC [Sphingomonadaceae bacterium]
METLAVVLEAPERLAFRRLALVPVQPGDVVVDIDFSGISSGTERLLWSGNMPPFPGMAYPLVPGYESIGRIVAAGTECEARVGERVFVPGSTCFIDAKGLFGGTAQRLIVPSARAIPVPDSLAEKGILIALASTAYHAIAQGAQVPDLIVGHGVLGRLLARIVIALGKAAPTVWETNPSRRGGAEGYAITNANDDDCRAYKVICDASGAPDLLDTLIGRLSKSGEIVLAGFYTAPLSFTFPPAFMREARFRIAAEWSPSDLIATRALIESGALSLDGLITHRRPAERASDAYPTAFGDAACLKMVLDWKDCS